MEVKHGGCIICGSTDQRILTSKTVSGQSVALCDEHVNAASLPKPGQKL